MSSNRRDPFRRCAAILAGAVVLSSAVAGEARASLIAATTSGGNLTSITTSDRGTITVANMIGVNVIHFHSAANTGIGLSVGGADPGVGNRATLSEDNSLITGLINTGTANGTGTSGSLSVAEQATVGPANTTLNGIGFTFLTPVVNGAGVDVVLFEYTDHSNTNPADGLIVSRLDGVLGFVTVANGAAGSAASERGGYTIEGAASGINSGTRDSNGASLNALESTGTWTAGSTVNQGYVGVGIDLSDLGFANGALVNGLFVADLAGGGNIDLVYIGGVPIPEPGTWAMLVVGAVAGAMFGRRCVVRK